MSTAKLIRVGTGRKVCETIHAVAAGMWLGALVMSGATAGILFTTMRTLGPSFQVFSAYEGDQSNLGAGVIQNEVFLALDAVQFGSATLVLATTIAGIVFFRFPIRRASSVVRLLALGAAMMLISFHLFILVPRMQTNAMAYWSAAELGETAAAQTAYDAFDADHPTARLVLMGTMFSVLVLLASGVWGAASAGEAEAQGPPIKPKGRGREEPALARKGGVR